MRDHSEPVRTGEIDLGNRRYKVSRNITTEQFRASVAELGVLDPVLLLAERDGYIALFGCNRIETASASGHDSVPALVRRSIDPEEYCRQCLLKASRGEIGPVGRVRALRLLASIDGAEGARAGLLRRHLAVPMELMKRPERLLSLPDELADFLDCRDVGYRTIRDLLDLPDGAVARISRWVAGTAMGVNIFKKVVELATEILRRDGTLDSVDEEAALTVDDRKAAAERLMEEISRRRYPRYTELHGRAETIRRKMAALGFDVDFPRYFEGDRFRVSITVNRGTPPDEVRRAMGSLPPDMVRELQELL
ncbi:MAG: hypothetical protein JXA20_15150 [Spirochaetes bacterium]|nr:hypothetical protein [Spirochaetota bacterium]